MELYLKMRRAHFQDGPSWRKIARDFGISRDSVSKMLAYSEPPGYRRTAPIKRPKLGGFTVQIDLWLSEDKSLPRKQCHTAKRIFERLRDECGFTGGYTIVKDYALSQKRDSKEITTSYAGENVIPFNDNLEMKIGESRGIHGGFSKGLVSISISMPY